MEDLNLLAGWIGIALGFVAGAVQGLLFHQDAWLGGYASWPRRMLRLAFALSVPRLGDPGGLRAAGWLFVAGAVGMPLCCYASAWRRGFRHLFFLPVVCLLIGTGLVLYRGLAR